MTLGVCKVCGKEVYCQIIRDYIEAYHIQGYSSKCEKCGKIYKTQNNLNGHRRRENYCIVERKDVILLDKKVRELFVHQYSTS